MSTTSSSSSIGYSLGSSNEPSMAARYTTASLFTALLSTWTYYAFHPPSQNNSISTNDDEAPPPIMMIHGPLTPLLLTTLYLTSLPILKYVTTHYLDKRYDMKTLLIESMILYNIAQVLFNAWMVYTIIIALLYNGHPFMGSREFFGPAIHSGATRAVYVHYCDKYLEFVDTYFMILRGKMDQVSFLHIYHHTTIAWAWWMALRYSPGGDIYFGALLNSMIHVMMYSYYALALLKFDCPWKRYLTQAQLLQFTSVVVYTCCTAYYHYYHVSHEAIDNVRPSLGIYYMCCGVQVFEMVSLFVLFSLFYKRKYSSGGKNCGGGGGGKEQHQQQERLSSSASSSSSYTNKTPEDQCHKAMGEISVAAKVVAGHAKDVAEQTAKDAGKFVSTATQAVKKRKGHVDPIGDARFC